MVNIILLVSAAPNLNLVYRSEIQRQVNYIEEGEVGWESSKMFLKSTKKNIRVKYNLCT